MVSITNQPFPVAKGEDAKRIAYDLQEAKKAPAEGTLDYRLAEYHKRIRAERGKEAFPRRVLYEN